MNGTATSPLRALYDTNILIDFLKHIPAAEAELARNRPNHISIVTWIEVMAGAPKKRAEETRTFLATFTTLPLTSEIAERAAAIRQQIRLKLPDAIILATAQHEGRTLVTRTRATSRTLACKFMSRKVSNQLDSASPQPYRQVRFEAPPPTRHRLSLSNPAFPTKRAKLETL